MVIHVWKGILKVPVKVCYLFSIIVSLALILCYYLFHLEEPGRHIICVDDYADPTHAGLSSAPHITLQGCSIDPLVRNTFNSCPKCFRPTVLNISEKFIEVAPRDRLFPRAPPNFFKLRNTVQQDFIREIVLAPTSVCVTTCPFLLALQLSVADRFEERDAIRATWGSVARTKIWPHATMNADFEILFVLAHKARYGDAAGEMERIRAEANRYGDLLYLDMMDSYNNLTLKLMSTLRWVRTHCPRTRFFLKVDADTFVNVPLLIDLLLYNQHLLDFSIVGHMYTGDKYAYRDGRWGVPKEIYPLATYPVYASGCAYVISRDAMLKVVDTFPYFPMIDLEDVYVTGILGRMTRIHFYSHHLVKVFTEYHSDRWDWCYLMNETLVSGTGVNRVFKRNLIWSGYLLNDWICRTRNLIRMLCYCEEEFTPRGVGGA